MMLDLKTLKFDEKGLIPAVVVDAFSKKVLTVAYMNRESLEISMTEGRTCFWSKPGRRAIWVPIPDFRHRNMSVNNGRVFPWTA